MKYLFNWLHENYSTIQGCLELDAAVKSGLPPAFGMRLSAILDSLSVRVGDLANYHHIIGFIIDI
jgi:hypothetical protein